MKSARQILHSIPPETVVPILTGNLRGSLWIRGASRNAYWLGMYERAKCNAFAAAIAPGAVVYDVGAHVGYYTLLASKRVGLRGHVFAFEPLPTNLNFLEQHLRLNHCANVTVIPAAVSSIDGHCEFQIEESRSMGQLAGVSETQFGDAAASRESPGERGTLPIMTLSLDSWVNQTDHPVPHVIKMDIEGAELLALQGAAELLQRVQPTLFVATHSTVLHQACQRFLCERGYNVEVLEWVETGERGELAARAK